MDRDEILNSEKDCNLFNQSKFRILNDVMLIGYAHVSTKDLKLTLRGKTSLSFPLVDSLAKT